MGFHRLIKESRLNQSILSFALIFYGFCVLKDLRATVALFNSDCYFILLAFCALECVPPSRPLVSQNQFFSPTKVSLVHDCDRFLDL